MRKFEMTVMAYVQQNRSTDQARVRSVTAGGQSSLQQLVPDIDVMFSLALTTRPLGFLATEAASKAPEMVTLYIFS